MSDGGFLDVVLEGHQLTQQLERYLNQCCSVERCRSVVHGILAAWEKLMYCVASNPIPDTKAVLSSHPLPKYESPEVSDNRTYQQQPYGDQEQQSQKLSKKRKSSLPTWTSQFHASSPSPGADDGFSWRKYGQKEILGFKQPRCYYRCSHRFTQHCPAKKQIQRSEHDVSVYDVKYEGSHTCVKKSKAKSPPRTAEDVPANPHFDIGILQSFKTSLHVQTEGLPGSDQEKPSTSASTSYLMPSFSTPSPLGDDGFTFPGSFSSFTSFMSPTGTTTVEDAGNSFWVDPFLAGAHDLPEMNVVAPSAIPPATAVSSAAAPSQLGFMGDALFEVDPDFPDFFA